MSKLEYRPIVATLPPLGAGVWFVPADGRCVPSQLPITRGMHIGEGMVVHRDFAEPSFMKGRDASYLLWIVSDLRTGASISWHPRRRGAARLAWARVTRLAASRRQQVSEAIEIKRWEAFRSRGVGGAVVR